jgi:anthranilate synthase component 1
MASAETGFGRPVDALRDILAQHQPSTRAEVPFLSRFSGGLVGYFSYDFVRYLERLPEPTQPRSSFPDFELGLYLDGIVYDHHRQRAHYFSHGEDRSHVVEKALADPLPAPDRLPLQLDSFESDSTQNEFCADVAQAKEHICSGDIYQVVLSKQLSAQYEGDLLLVYEVLRRINPSPYMFHLDFGRRVISGSSPEMLICVQENLITGYPIAGTRPLGQNEKERERYARELSMDEKERAEHAMLVDLARNDIGRVAEYGSVRVPQYMQVESFSHVQHLVSRVEGRLRKDLDALAALTAVFPAGTVSGAPKPRAMEIIQKLERSPRGPYAGAVGYLSLNGHLDTAITIRTLFADTHAQRLFLRAGAGIVYDSVAEREWDETERKLEAMKVALKGAASCACL